MNLDFHTIATVHKNGALYKKQVARIPSGRAASVFWRTWRASKEELKRHFRVFRGRDGFYLERLYPVQPDSPYGTFASPYLLRHTDRLLPYQHEPVRYLVNAVLNNVTAADGSDTGLGKSYVALAVCRELDVRPGIVCKKSGIAGWKRACKYMGIVPEFLINYEKLKTGKTVYLRRETYIIGRPVYENGRRIVEKKHFRFIWTVPEKTLLIFDESHECNHIGSQNNLLYRAASKFPSLSLSATFADRPQRMFTLLSMLRIMDYEEFSEYLRQRGVYTSVYGGQETVSESDIMNDFSKLIYPHKGYRLDYSTPAVRAVFPDAVFIAETITIDNKTVSELNKYYSQISHTIDNLKQAGKSAEALTADLRYRQAAELAKAPVLAELARQYLYENKSVCIFVNFRQTREYLQEHLKTTSSIYGGQPDREAVLQAFQDNRSRIIICMIQAGGQSIDLHDIHGGAQRISLICPTNSAVQFRQTCGRTYRAGSRTPPIIKLIYTAGTIEEKVSERVRSKLNNIQKLNDSDFIFFE